MHDNENECSSIDGSTPTNRGHVIELNVNHAIGQDTTFDFFIQLYTFFYNKSSFPSSTLVIIIVIYFHDLFLCRDRQISEAIIRKAYYYNYC